MLVEWGTGLLTSPNIAGLGMAFLITYHHTKRYSAYRMTSPEVNSCLYIRQEATLPLPSQGITPRPFEGTHVSYAGWSRYTSLRTSQSSPVLAILSTSALRKQNRHKHSRLLRNRHIVTNFATVTVRTLGATLKISLGVVLTTGVEGEIP